MVTFTIEYAVKKNNDGTVVAGKSCYYTPKAKTEKEGKHDNRQS